MYGPCICPGFLMQLQLFHGCTSWNCGSQKHSISIQQTIVNAMIEWTVKSMQQIHLFCNNYSTNKNILSHLLKKNESLFVESCSMLLHHSQIVANLINKTPCQAQCNTSAWTATIPFMLLVQCSGRILWKYKEEIHDWFKSQPLQRTIRSSQATVTVVSCALISIQT